MDWTAYLWSGTALFMLAIIFWLPSLKRNDVSIVDSLWSPMFQEWLALETDARGGRRLRYQLL